MFRNEYQPGTKVETGFTKSVQPHEPGFFEDPEKFNGILVELRTALQRHSELENNNAPEAQQERAQVQDVILELSRIVAEFKSRNKNGTMH